MVDIPDIITCANFGEDRLRDLGVAGCQNLPFSIDFDRRPYNTVALPRECVIWHIDSLGGRSDIFEVASKLVQGFGSGRGAKFCLSH